MHGDMIFSGRKIKQIALKIIYTSILVLYFYAHVLQHFIITFRHSSYITQNIAHHKKPHQNGEEQKNDGLMFFDEGIISHLRSEYPP